MRISLIAAMTPTRAIGFQNKMPWHIPADLQHFKKLTLHKTVLMGRKTFLSIGKALPQRNNLILSRDPNFIAFDATVIHSLNELPEHVRDDEELMVIGGANIYEQLLPQAQRLYLTLIDADFEGDAFFPPWSKHDFFVSERSDHAANTLAPFPLAFLTLDRRT